MPSRYIVRDFKENSIYHVFNRGIEKRDLFLDEQDFKMFLYYLMIYLLPLEKIFEKYPYFPLRLQARNLSKELELLCYCLMPNHFHLLIKQITRDGISKLLKQVMNGYTLYFNEKYERLGSLIQGSFRAVEIINDDLLLHVFRYIHLNPAVSGIVKKPVEYRWSSYSFYLQGKESICKKDLFLSYFPSLTKLREFTEDQIDYAKQLDKIKHLTIE